MAHKVGFESKPRQVGSILPVGELVLRWVQPHDPEGLARDANGTTDVIH